MGGSLAAALQRALSHPVEVVCAGRTDAGVHAWGQVVSFDARPDADLARLQRSLNKMLAPTISLREVAWAPEGFDARRWAISRTYRYELLCTSVPDPLSAPTVWHVGQPLDLRGMQQACDPFLGEHDFSSFCHRAPGRPMARRVLRAEWSDLGGGRLRFEVEATSFCHQMVRSLVGTMVEVGRGRRRAGDMLGVLEARNRAAAGPVAPPHGLCLWEVRYPAEPGAAPGGEGPAGTH